jgi:triosephosphate isomerase
MKNIVYIANFKNYFTLQELIQWANHHKESLRKLAENHTLVLCPSFEALSQLSTIIKDTGVMLGAQDCSPFGPGAHTGHVLAESLKQIGCQWTIIGHSETQTPPDFLLLRLKAEQLLKQNITPIICMGETEQDFKQARGAKIIEDQIKQLFTEWSNTLPHKTLSIAYEPLWAINHVDPHSYESYLIEQLALIEKLCTQLMPDYSIQVYYGGGVNQSNADQMKQMPFVDGLLIGKASTDFQKLQKIVG